MANEQAILETIASEGCFSFSYQRSDQMFLVGGVQFPLSKSLEADMFQALRLKSGLPPDELQGHSLIWTNTGSLYGLTGLRKVLSRDLAEDSALVMQEAYEVLTGHRGQPDFFESRFCGSGSYEAQLLGAPALHAMAEGSVGEAGWQYGIYEYGTNNADLPEWKVILFAAVGHVAAIADSRA